MTNGPSLEGSPSSRATLAPLGSDGGASCHLMSAGVTITSCFFSSAGRAPTPRARDRTKAAARRDTRCMACSGGRGERAAGIVAGSEDPVTFPSASVRGTTGHTLVIAGAEGENGPVAVVVVRRREVKGGG